MGQMPNHDSKSRRAVLSGIASAIALPLVALGQQFPVRPLRRPVGFAAGGATDIALRALPTRGHYLGPAGVGGCTNRRGRHSSAQLLQTAAADGYTIAHIGIGVYRLPYTVKLAWDPYTDISHIIRLAGYVIGPFTAVAGPIRTWADFVQAARKNPGLMAYGSPGALTGSHVAMALTAERLGLRLTHVPYGEAPKCGRRSCPARCLSGSMRSVRSTPRPVEFRVWV